MEREVLQPLEMVIFSRLGVPLIHSCRRVTLPVVGHVDGHPREVVLVPGGEHGRFDLSGTRTNWLNFLRTHGAFSN